MGWEAEQGGCLRRSGTRRWCGSIWGRWPSRRTGSWRRPASWPGRRRCARERGIDEARIGPLITRAAIAGIVGARFFYVLNHPSEFALPLDWLRF
jgi:hypothetical protein